MHQGEAHRVWPYSIAAIVSRAKRARAVICRLRASVLAELRSVEIQDSTRRVFVIQALNGAIRTD
jgi:hypothetical protein